MVSRDVSKILNLLFTAQDFTFTRQIKGRPIGLGEAGDCYSKLKCPQGSFRISLEGTLLQISQTQKWVGRTIGTTYFVNHEVSFSVKNFF